MTRFEMDPALNTGHELIDEQHHGLFELAGRLELACEGLDCGEPVDDAIYDLTEYCVEHFSDEEGLMKEAHYPELNVHSQLHAALTEHTMGMAARFFNGDEIEPAEIARFVVEWLRDHIESADRRFVDWLRTQAV